MVLRNISQIENANIFFIDKPTSFNKTIVTKNGGLSESYKDQEKVICIPEVLSKFGEERNGLVANQGSAFKEDAQVSQKADYERRHENLSLETENATNGLTGKHYQDFYHNFS